jgi:hypothetical protein
MTMFRTFVSSGVCLDLQKENDKHYGKSLFLIFPNFVLFGIQMGGPGLVFSFEFLFCDLFLAIQLSYMLPFVCPRSYAC